MSENKYRDYAPNTDARSQAPTFDEMVAMIEKLFKDYLKDIRKNALTGEQIEEGWQRYKTLNHLYQDEQPKPAGAVWVKASLEHLPLHKAFWNIEDGFKKDCSFPVIIDGNVYGMADLYDNRKEGAPDSIYYFVVKGDSEKEYYEDEFHRIEWLDETGVASNTDAIEFAEWIKAEGWNQRASIDWAKYETIYSDVSVKTTVDLYKLWQQSKK